MSRVFEFPSSSMLVAVLMLSAGASLDGVHAKSKEGVLYAFAGGTDGQAPYPGPVDKKGNLYGTTIVGGSNALGTVYEIAASGAETVLYSFAGGNDGSRPVGGLIFDKQGNLYGTTQEGGSKNCNNSGCGTVFKIAADGTETVLYAFAGGASDGATPGAGVVMDASGNLYGTTQNGGTDNYGTVFEITAAGKESVLYSFTDGSDGATPYAGVILDKSGNLYGTAGYGGTNNAGTVFEVAANGTETTLYAFTGQSDGGNSFAPLLADKAGNFFGTTAAGGSAGEGVLFELSPNGTETVLHTFVGGSDGANPYSGLVANKKGDLYGTTYGGGSAGTGTVFEVTAKGAEKVLHAFAGGSDGAYPKGGVALGKAGTIYGPTTAGGGTGCGGSGCGVVFKISK